MSSRTVRQLIVFGVFIVNAVQLAHGQVSDQSDAYWSIVIPEAASVEVDMGQVPVGSAKDTLVLAYLTNTGPVGIRIDTLFLEGSGASAFALISEAPPFTIPKGESKEIEFHFAPGSAEMFLATVVVRTQTDTLNGGIRGMGVQPRIEVVSRLVDFGRVKVNAVRDTDLVALLRNVGTGTLEITAIEQLGPDFEQFDIVSGDAPFTLAPGRVHPMRLRFAPKRPGRSSGSIGFHHQGPGSPAVVDLFGEGLSLQATATLRIDTIQARVGEMVEVPVYLQRAQDLQLSGVTGFQLELFFNASLLAPVGNTPRGTVMNGRRSITLDNLPVQPDFRGAVARLQFVAMLGDTEGTALEMENLSSISGDAAMTATPGYFRLLDLCREGGARLFEATGTAGLMQNRPNPFNAMTIIEFETIEIGPTRLVVMDLMGRIVSLLVDDTRPAGRYAAAFDATSMRSGVYFCVLYTPTGHFIRLMQVAK